MRTAPILLLLLLVGCQSLSPTQQYRLASNMYADVLVEVTKQSQLGIHSLETMEKVAEIKALLSVLFDQYELALLNNQDTAPILSAVQRAVDQLILIQIQGARHDRS